MATDSTIELTTYDAILTKGAGTITCGHNHPTEADAEKCGKARQDGEKLDEVTGTHNDIFLDIEASDGRWLRWPEEVEI
jgi:hypothetical protein